MSKKKKRKLELTPEIIYSDLDETKYKGELEVLDRFLSFSAELLRLSLLGIAVVGFFYKFVIPKFGLTTANTTLIILCVMSFAISSLLALTCRYLAADAFRFYIYGLRINPKSEDEAISSLKKRNRRLRFCLIFKASSAILLVSGVFLLSAAFINLVRN
ncbi:MAG: hypothetical protein KAV87_27320 [Desulfobacteraceae bacterium]|nr:hypothetical protein [Desulfobacteraceae bacterium]